ncbi:hypothetical protein [Erysipelothrix piscisicarius]|uniref:hypothetical protein n=1 Tax=Erysipelothrix piscisicarius TaxID=2485784 RepID=UPI002F9591E3
MRFLETARAYKKQDPAVRSVLEVILLYPGYHAMGFIESHIVSIVLSFTSL